MCDDTYYVDDDFYEDPESVADAVGCTRTGCFIMGIVLAFVILAIVLSTRCSPHCRDVTYTFYTMDSVEIPEMGYTNRQCDTELEMTEGQPQWFPVRQDSIWVLQCYKLN